MNKDGNDEVVRDMFTILTIDGSRILRCSFKSQVGMGSKQHDFDGKDRIIASIDSADTGWNSDNSLPLNERCISVCTLLLLRLSWIAETFSTKRAANHSARCLSEEDIGRAICLRFRSLSTVWNSVL